MKLSDVIDVTESDCEYQWMYRGVRGGWWKYDTSSNSELEDLYNEWMISQHSDYDSDLDSYASDDPVPEILIGATHFEIDFNRMRQINRDTKYARPIKRIKSDKLDEFGGIIKGISGLSARN